MPVITRGHSSALAWTTVYLNVMGRGFWRAVSWSSDPSPAVVGPDTPSLVSHLSVSEHQGWKPLKAAWCIHPDPCSVTPMRVQRK